MTSPPQLAIELSSLTKSFGSVRANRSVSLRVSQGSTFVEDNPILNERVKFLRGYLEEMLNDDKAMSLIANLPEGEELSRKQLKDMFGLGEGYEFVVTRLYHVINHGIDPEVVPIIVGLDFDEKSGLPKSVSDSFANDTTLTMKFLELMIDKDFRNEFFHEAYPGAKPYSEGVTGKLDEIKNKWIKDIQKNDNDQKTVEKFEEAFDKYFNIKRELWAAQCKLYNSDMYLQGATNSKYFEHRSFDTIGQITDWSPNSFNGVRSNMDLIKSHAISLERGKYLVSLFKVVDSLYAKYFPEIYVSPDVDKLTIEDPFRSYNHKPDESCDEANGHWYKGEIGIKSGTVIRPVNSSDISEEDTLHFGGPKVKRKVNDLIVMTHEFTHAIYEKTVRKNTDTANDYHSTADHAVNEGASVLMELLMADMLIENSKELGFDQKEIEQFESVKQARLYSLKKHKNGYTQGTYRILHKVYKDGAGNGGQRNMHNGLEAVKEFLGKIDIKKTMSIKRDSFEYTAALKSGGPTEWLKLFGN
jgi:hypothetical protein